MADSAIQEVETKKKKRSFGKILLLSVNGLIFLGGVGFFLLAKTELLNKAAPTQQVKPSGQVVAKADTSADMPQVQTKHIGLNLPALVVNLSGDSGQRFLRIGLRIEAKNQQAREFIEENLIPIQNSLIFLLSSKTFKNISTVEGKQQLQQDIQQNLNDTLGHTLVTKIYFREFIVQ